MICLCPRHGWCEGELAANKQTRESKANQVSTLEAERDEIKASIGQVKDENKQMADEVAEIDASVVGVCKHTFQHL